MKKELWFPSSDMLYEVLSKLFTQDLVKIKCVSKGWQCLISDRSFIKVQLKKMEPLEGFLYQSRRQWLDGEDYDWIDFIPTARITTEVHSDVLGFLPESVGILDSSYGLICCRSIFPCPAPVIYICNPVNKEWKELQWPNPSIESCITLVFDPFKNPIDAFTNFKVVIVNQNETSAEGDGYYSFNIYSSETGEWTRSAEICLCNHNMQKRGGICVQGILYWLTDGDQILMFDPEKEISWLIMVPLPTTQIKLIPEMCMGEVEGKLHYVLISEHGLQLWALKDHLISQWDLTITISLEELEKEIQKNKYLFYFKLADSMENDHMVGYSWWIKILAFKDNMLPMRVGADIFFYHFETRKMRHFSRIDDLGSNSFIFASAAPYTMSLVPLA